MTETTSPQPVIIDRRPNSEAKTPDAAIAATAVGNETVLLGRLQSVDGKTAYLRVGRMGYRILFKNKFDDWVPVPAHNNVHGINLGTSAIGRVGEIVVKLHALEFKPDTVSSDLIDSLKGTSSATYSEVREHRSVAPAEYLPAEVQALREFSAGASQFRGY